MAIEKKCTKCGEAKSLTGFSKHRGKKDGLQSQCKVCVAVYNKAYYLAHVQELAAYRAGHKKEIADKGKSWYAKHKEKRAAYQKAWRDKNPEKKAAQLRRYRARKKGATVAPVDLAEIWERDERKCVYCGMTENLSIDHIKPLAKGGSHSPDNLCVACRSCNSSKGAKSLIGWLASTNKLDALEQGYLI